MLEIEFTEKLEGKMYEIINKEFDKYAEKSDIVCNYKPFSFLAKIDGNFAGIITGHSYYKEVHIGDLIVLEQYRKNHIGSELMKKVEEYFSGKGFENMNLTTYGFQAPEFYKKCGFSVEFVRENKNNPKLNKYYMVKYF